MAKRTFICRCEDVSVGEIEHAIAQGLETIEEIKRYTGLGTGPCQGKECMTPISKLLHARGLVSIEALRPFTARPPAAPVTFGALATVGDETLADMTVRTHRANADDPEEPPA